MSYGERVVTVTEQLRSVVRASDARVAVVTAAEALSVGEWRLLHALHTAGAVPPSRLADDLGLTRGGVTKLIDRLRARRLLVRAASGQADRRYQTLALTGAGAVVVQRLLTEVTVAAKPTPAERAALLAALREEAGR